MTKANGAGQSVQRRTTVALAIVALMGLVAASALAAAPAAKAKEKKRRIIAITINKGQNVTITGVKQGTSAGPKVVNNPNALVVQNAPGRIELVGADQGVWKLNVTLATGEKVTYVVTVKALAPPQGSLAPAAAPTVLR